MMSQIPINFEKETEFDLSNQILRDGMIAELDAINLYEQMSAMSGDSKIKSVLSSITKEEKTHLGEFLAALLERDREQEKELEAGKKEVEAMA